MEAPKDWHVSSESMASKVITVSPKIGTGLFFGADSVVWACMERFGEVEEGMLLVWGDVEGCEIEALTQSQSWIQNQVETRMS